MCQSVQIIGCKEQKPNLTYLSRNLLENYQGPNRSIREPKEQGLEYKLGKGGSAAASVSPSKLCW